MTGTSINGAKRPSIFTPSLRQSQFTVLWMFLGYIGYYFVRVHFATVFNAIRDDGVLDKHQYGYVIAVAYMMNVFGKVGGGALVDILNRPKLVFMAALVISALVAVINTVWTSFIGWILLWSMARFFTSFGFGSVLKIASAWWPPEVMGTILGLASLSCCLGESFTRVTLGLALKTMTWRQVYLLAAGIALTLGVPAFLFVKDRPPASYAYWKRESTAPMTEISLKDESCESNGACKANGLCGDDDNVKPSERRCCCARDAIVPSTKPTTPQPPQSFYHQVVLPLAKSPRFLLLVIMCTCATILRETYSNWSTVFLADLGVSNSLSGVMTAVLPVAGSFATVLGGTLIDRVSRVRRGLIPLAFLLVLTALQIALVIFSKFALASKTTTDVVIALVLFGATSFTMWAPYSFFDGVFVFDVIGSKGVAFGSGVISGTSYLGAAAGMVAVGHFAKSDDWTATWLMSAGFAAITTITAVGYWILDRRHVLQQQEKELLDRQAGPDGVESESTHSSEPDSY